MEASTARLPTSIRRRLTAALVTSGLVALASGCSEAPPFDAGNLSRDPPTIAQVSAGRGSWCLVDVEGIGRCWGANGSGQLGDGTRVRNRLPTRVAGGLEFRWIGSSTWRHRCGIAEDGRAYCWGANDFGELGTGGTDASLEPVPVAGDVRFASIGTGVAFSCGLSVDGGVWCWGQNRRGQQGTGEAGTAVPSSAVGDPAFSGLSVGDEYTCGVDGDGDAYCTGLNTVGQLGIGTATSPGSDAERPPDPSGRFRKVVGDHRFRMVAARFDHTCGVTVAGDLYCWGSHRDWQLGPLRRDSLGRCEVAAGTRIPCATEPMKVPLTGTKVTHVSVGSTTTCVTTGRGEILCWGRGFANPTPIETPQRDEDFVAVHTFGFGGSSCARAESGRVYCGPTVGHVQPIWTLVRFPQDE